MIKTRQKWLLLLCCGVGLSAHASLPTISRGDLPVLSQQSQHATAAKRISNIYTRSHYRSIPFDDALSEEFFDKYLEQIDYSRTLFTQGDIANFSRYETLLDDYIPEGRLEPLYSMFNLSIQRRYEQLTYSLSLLNEPMRFDTDEYFQFDRSEAQWPNSPSELKELWRLKVKSDALSLRLADREWPQISEILTKRYNSTLKRLSQTTSEDVFQSAMNAYSRAIEPHTSYLSPRNAERFRMEMNLSLEGIGAVLQGENEHTVIRSLVAGGPADLSEQLKPNDKIVGVGQSDGKIVDIVGWRLDDVVDLIKGPKGSIVYLEVLSGESKTNSKTRVVKITRDKIRLEDRAAKARTIEVDGKTLGVLEVPGFYVNLSEDARKELAELPKTDGLIVDLRGNGGGSLSEATSLTGLFIKDGPVVQVRDHLGRISVNSDNNESISYEGPMVILVDRYSASASEIFAAALQDYGRALVIGEQTYGKGTVQQHRGIGRVYDLYENPLGHVQYTIAKFYRINGGSTQHRGVIPDITYPSPLLPEETGESIEDNALPWDQIAAASYKPIHANLDKVVKQLNERHQQRIAKNPEFQYILQDIDKYRAEKDSLVLSLNYQKRLQEQKTKDKLQLDRINERLLRMKLKQIATLEDLPADIEFEDAFLNEAAKIAIDYSLLAKKD